MRFRLFGRVYYLSKKIGIIGIICALALVVAVGRYLLMKRTASLAPLRETETDTRTQVRAPSPAPTVARLPAVSSEAPPQLLAIHISGEVISEGVYWVESGMILADVIQLAGGLTEDADTYPVNLALRVADGMHIHIPAKSSPDKSWLLETGSTAGILSQSPAPALININTASVEELMSLSGVGESTAKDIVRYRELNGPFQVIEDIMNVSGIKEARFQRFRDQITV